MITNENVISITTVLFHKYANDSDEEVGYEDEDKKSAAKEE